MDAFDINSCVKDEYAEFSSSFTRIRARDIGEGLKEHLDNGHFWPSPLLLLNPRFRPGRRVEEVAAAGELEPETAQIFNLGGPLHLHQEQAISKAAKGESFVVTTGTGSGKSLCFFIPIIDHIIRAKKKGEGKRTRAIILYPMNALANSQLEEIQKFLNGADLPENIMPTVARFTGQEKGAERQRIAENPPDILLTNFMMAELLLVRQEEIDRKVIDNARDIRFLVLDELHVYRGRQGADVAALMRRLQQRCGGERPPICIGTSATMSSGEAQEQAGIIADVASRLFGVKVKSDAIIGETLERVTEGKLPDADELRGALEAGIPAQADDETLKRHPLARWVELALGLEDSHGLRRRPPLPMDEAILRLAKDSGLTEERCEEALPAFLKFINLPEKERGGEGDRSFLAYKLHRFFSGAEELYTTLHEQPRRVFLEGQLFDPENPNDRLFPTRFCRECGQEFYVVTLSRDGGGEFVIPRGIDDQPLGPEEIEELGEVAGYLTPVAEEGDADYAFDGSDESLPENWLEERGDQLKLRAHYRKRRPRPLRLGADGRENAAGKVFWFLPGRFSFCPRCLDTPVAQMRERNKLAGISGDGRSSASTIMISSVLEWMHRDGSGILENKRKLLSFTDNRQDASLQAGHFNDFVFISRLRAALLKAVMDAGDGGLGEAEFGMKTAEALGFTLNLPDRFHEWMISPEAGPEARRQCAVTLNRVLAHRVWADLRRGWRFTNPNLISLGLICPSFLDVKELAAAGDFWKEVADATGVRVRKPEEVLRIILGFMLESLAVDSESLDAEKLDVLAGTSRDQLLFPWVIDDQEKLPTAAVATLQIGKKRKREALASVGYMSRLGRKLNRRDLFGERLTRQNYENFIAHLLPLLERKGLLVGRDSGWRLKPGVLRLMPGEAITKPEKAANKYFRDHYWKLVENLRQGRLLLSGFEAREHTAQVEMEVRQWREHRFRYEKEDREFLQNNRGEISQSGESDRLLPVLACSPTMELGVDISELNVVHLRNVPPTPANYAQRAGRAGRSGQAAAIFTYCAAGSPHDQYYFRHRDEMVSGIVRPPMLDLSNEELLRSHLNAVWLAALGIHLSGNIPDVLRLDEEGYPLQPDILERVRDDDLVEKAYESMFGFLQRMLPAMEPQPEWLGNPGNWVKSVLRAAPDAFDGAFDRWRELYKAAFEQANASIPIGLSQRDRKRIDQLRGIAVNQMHLLEKGDAVGSDFYTYRYLATEGFLPGYNFPRLPLYAYIPGRRERKSHAWIQRPRFLGIAEFGPRSLIYHEGRAYRVVRAKLPPDARDEQGGLATSDLFLCGNCGAMHEREVERCHACDEPLGGGIPVRQTLRIDNVETVPTERITANDEERQRQGFEIQTVFSWGRANVLEAEVISNGEPMLRFQYATSAMICRINKGLRRRRDKNVLGFMIDPQTGNWQSNEDGEEQHDAPQSAPPTRVVPVVTDYKNALLMYPLPPGKWPEDVMATLQHALLRGITRYFQLEEGEVLADPLPARDDRRTLLFYEAAEGGAGVLRQLLEAENLRAVARTALEMMHYENIDNAVEHGDIMRLKPANDACVRGCYHCLLSYYNQPDHELINRQNEQVLDILLQLVRADMRHEETVETRAQDDHDTTAADPTARWRLVVRAAGLPDPEELRLPDITLPFAWRHHLVAATPDKISGTLREMITTLGWTIVSLPPNPESDEGRNALAKLKELLEGS